MRRISLPAALPAVSGSASRFLTVSDLFRLGVSPMNTGSIGISGLRDRFRRPTLHQAELRPPFVDGESWQDDTRCSIISRAWPSSFCQSTVQRQRGDVRPLRSTVAPAMCCCRRLPLPRARDESQTPLRFAPGASRPWDSAYHGLRERSRSVMPVWRTDNWAVDA